MKNEEKIIELLSEYLQKTDRTLERMEKSDKKFDEVQAELAKHSDRIDLAYAELTKHFKKIDLAYDVLMKHSDELISLRKASDELRKESMKREIQQEALLKEIFSISRRVANIEDEK